MTDPYNNPALSMLNDMHEQETMSRHSGIPQTELVAANEASRRIGSENVEYIGKDRWVELYNGSGEIYSPRLAMVAAASRGGGIMERIAGHGSLDAQESTILTGRTAVSEDDTARTFRAALSGNPIAWNNNESGYIDMSRLAVAVPIPAGVTTALSATAYLDCEAANTATGIEGSLVLGAGVTGLPWLDNQDPDTSPTWTTGYDGGRNVIPLFHERLFCPPGRIGDPVTIQIVPRIRKIGGASGGYYGGTGLKPGATFRVVSTANVRSSPAILDDNISWVASAGLNGTIVAGPTSADGYSWYDVAITGYGTGYIASSLIQATSNDPQVGQTNRIHNGIVIVRREPV